MIASLGLCGLIFVAQVPPPQAAEAVSAALAKESRTIRAGEARRLEALADRLKARGEAALAEEVRRLIEPAPAPDGPTRFVPLPEVVPPSASGLANVPARLPAASPERAELRTIRESAADAFFDLAERAASSKHYALADECLRAVLERQPDQARARRLLGYVPHNGGWATPYAVAQLRDGKVLHPKFGWVKASWVPHLDLGELPAPPVKGQAEVHWLPAEEADRLHGTWGSGWRFFTEHFVIETDVPFSEAIAFGKQLEAFHGLFFAHLADLFAADDRLPLARRFRSPKLVGEAKTDPHVVDYFKDKSEYVEHLTQTKGPGLEGSLGFYDPPRRGVKRAPAYFYRDPGGQLAASATLYHEVSHQLLFESAGAYTTEKNPVGFWVFEGLGTYFETVVAEPSGALLVGGLVGPRIEEAEKRLLDLKEFVPTARFVAMPKDRFNEQSRVVMHYQEAMALTAFLMQFDGGRYREPFLDYVRDVYRGRLRGNSGRSLQDRLGVPYATLDSEFLDYLKRGRDAAAPREGR